MRDKLLLAAIITVIISGTNIILSATLGWLFDLKAIEIAALYCAFMVAWLVTGWYRSQKYAKEYRKSLKEFQNQIEGSKNGN